MSEAKRWVSRHKVLSIVLALWALLWIATLLSGDISAATIVATLILISPGVLVVWLLGKVFKGETEDERAGDVRPYVSPAASQASPGGPASDPFSTSTLSESGPQPLLTEDISAGSAENQQQLSQLDATTRITVSNALTVDESILYVLPGSGHSLVGTERRVLIVPSDRDGFQNVRAIPYLAVGRVWVDQRKAGGSFHIEGALEGDSEFFTIELETHESFTQGAQVAREIRGRADAARQAAQGHPVPAVEAADPTLCNTCGATLPDSARFCPSCGSKTGASLAPSA